MPKDYYHILGIPKEASAEQVKKRYRKLAMQYHPDRNLGEEQWANEKIKEINEAFSVLGDPEKRGLYDQFGTNERVNIGDIFNSPSTRSTFDDPIRDFSRAGLRSDFLRNMFGSFAWCGGPSDRFSGGFWGASGAMFAFGQVGGCDSLGLCIDDFAESRRIRIREAVADWIQRGEGLTTPERQREQALASADKYLKQPGSISVTWKTIAEDTYAARIAQAAEPNEVHLCIDDFDEPGSTKIRETVADSIQRWEGRRIPWEHARTRADQFLKHPGSISVVWAVIAKAIYQERRHG